MNENEIKIYNSRNLDKRDNIFVRIMIFKFKKLGIHVVQSYCVKWSIRNIAMKFYVYNILKDCSKIFGILKLNTNEIKIKNAKNLDKR